MNQLVALVLEDLSLKRVHVHWALLSTKIATKDQPERNTLISCRLIVNKQHRLHNSTRLQLGALLEGPQLFRSPDESRIKAVQNRSRKTPNLRTLALAQCFLHSASLNLGVVFLFRKTFFLGTQLQPADINFSVYLSGSHCCRPHYSTAAEDAKLFGSSQLTQFYWGWRAN